MTIRTFSLERYEDRLPADLLHQAQGLLTEHAPHWEVSRVRAGHWMTHWPALNLETEVKVGRVNVRDYSCDCTHFQSEGICSHIAALVIWIAGQRQQHTQQRRAARSEPKIARMDVGHLVKLLTQADLQQFVLRECKRNADLRWSLKAEFGHRLVLVDDQDKYLRIIRGFAGKSKSGAALSRSGFAKASRFLANLIDIAGDQMATGNHREAWLIARDVLQFISVTRPVAPPTWQEVSLATHRILELLLAPPPVAIALKHEMATWLLHQLAQGYEVFDRRLNVYSLISRNLPAFSDQVLPPLDDFLVRHSDQPMAPLAWVQIGMDKYDLPHIEQLLVRFVHQLGQLRQFFQSLLDHGDRPMILAAAHAIFSNAQGAGVQRWALQILLEYEPDEVVRENLLIDYISQARALDLIPMLRSISCNWNVAKAVLEDAFRDQGDEKLMLALWQATDDLEQIKQMLKTTESWDVLLMPAVYLYHADSGFFAHLMMERTYDHLDHHVGPRSAAHVSTILQRLRQQGLADLSRQLLSNIRKRYADRTALLDNLSDYGH